MIELPPELDREWHAHGYYGSANHNVKAIYQRYLGWFDANPAHLWQHPPEAAGTRYVQALGGVAATVAKAREFFEQGDLRFAAELASHAVFADPGNAGREGDARHGAGAAGLRGGERDLAQQLPHRRTRAADEQDRAHRAQQRGLAPALTITQLFDSIAIRIDGPKAWSERLSVGWHFTDVHENYRMELSNGALIHYPTTGNQTADLTVTLTRPQLLQLLATAKPDGIDMSGRPRRPGAADVAHRRPRPRLRDRHPLAARRSATGSRATKGGQKSPPPCRRAQPSLARPPDRDRPTRAGTRSRGSGRSS